MHYKFSFIFLLLLTSSSSSSSSSLSSIFSLLSNEGETEAFTPSPFYLLSRLLSRDSAGISAGDDLSLLTLETLLSAVEEEIEKLDKEKEREYGGIERGEMEEVEEEIEKLDKEREREYGGIERGEMEEVIKTGIGERGSEEEDEEEEEMKEEMEEMEEKKEMEEYENHEVGEWKKEGKEGKEKENYKKYEEYEDGQEGEYRKINPSFRRSGKQESYIENEENDEKMQGKDHELQEKERKANYEQGKQAESRKISGKQENYNGDEEKDEKMQGKDHELQENERKTNSEQGKQADSRKISGKHENYDINEEKDEKTHEKQQELQENERKTNDKENQATRKTSHLGNYKENEEKLKKTQENYQESKETKSERIPFQCINEIIKILQQVQQLLKENLRSRFRHIFNYYLPKNRTAAISEDCAIDADVDTLTAPVNKKWFLKFFDSWGKIPDGFFWGNINAPGMYEECVTMQVTSVATVDGQNVTRSYRGRYCTVSYRPNATEKAVLPNSRSGVSLATLAKPVPFTYGTCVPSTCTAKDLEASLVEVLREDGLEVTGVHCQLGEVEGGEEVEEEVEEEEEDSGLTPQDKAFISIMSILGILAVLATIYEVIVITRNISSFEGIMNFSLLHNLGRVFTYEDRRKTGDVITCLPMLRVVTMLWIIICHQYETNTTFIANLFDSLTYQEPAFAQIVTDGWLSVDTFFFLAGLLLAYRLVPYLRPDSGYIEQAKILLIVIVRRIVRLAPVILVVALFCASLLRNLAHGPNARVLEGYSELCVDHWWKDPLFINNYLFAGNEGDSVNDCLAHCWYTAVDVQLLVLLPVIFLPALYHQLAGVVVLCVLSVASIVIPLAITLAFDLPPSPLHHVLGEKRLEYMTHIFMAPWCRMGPWLVGVWTGLILRTSWAKRVKINKFAVFIGYIIAIIMGFTLVVGLLPYNRLHFSHELVDKDWQEYPAISAFYGALARPTWGLCVAWVVFTCHTGNAAFINKILSYRGWLPLSRLTFGIYIVAPVVQIWWATGLLVPTYFNYVGKLFESSGVFSVSLLFAIILSCLVELPLISTFNLFLPSPARKHERAVLAKNSSATTANGSDHNYGDQTFSFSLK